jgi:hypothetical protein
MPNRSVLTIGAHWTEAEPSTNGCESPFAVDVA